MFRANICGSLDGGMVGLYYNSAAGSFHTKKLVSRLYLIEIEFYLKKQKIKPLFGDLEVVYALHL